jgi:hypothetical protein
VDNAGHSNNVSFWHSSFRNLRINGGFASTDTVWGMELGMPWRSTFENIEIEGCRNGIKVINNATMQNAGDCVFSRFFVEIVGTGGYALYVDSIDGNMNQNTWIDFEAGANSTGCTGIYLGGTAGTASQRFIGNLNLEQFQTLINVANGNSNVFDCNYITCDTGGATNKGFVTGSNSYNNTFRAAYFNIASSDSREGHRRRQHHLERAEHLRAHQAGEQRQRNRHVLQAEQHGVPGYHHLQQRQRDARRPAAVPADGRQPSRLHTRGPRPADLDCTTRPSPVRVRADVRHVYLSKLKIVNRSTVVSNIIYQVTTAHQPHRRPVLRRPVRQQRNTPRRQRRPSHRHGVHRHQDRSDHTPDARRRDVLRGVARRQRRDRSPQVAGAAGNTSVTNGNLSAAASRSLTTAAGNTSLPSSITLSSQSRTSPCAGPDLLRRARAMADDLLVIIPTRGRPQAVPEIVQAWDDTGATADLLFAVDTDDPEIAGYKKHAADLKATAGCGSRSASGGASAAR